MVDYLNRYSSNQNKGVGGSHAEGNINTFLGYVT